MENLMRKFLITATAGVAIFSAGSLTANLANAMPIGASTGARLALDGMSPVSKVALCFYIDGWNGPGMYDCGFRDRRGHGWHGKRHDNGHHADHHDNHHDDKEKHKEDKH
jgi:hypothetical protein